MFAQTILNQIFQQLFNRYQYIYLTIKVVHYLETFESKWVNPDDI